VTSSWFFLSTLNYDARSTTHQIHLRISTITATIKTIIVFCFVECLPEHGRKKSKHVAGLRHVFILCVLYLVIIVQFFKLLL